MRRNFVNYLALEIRQRKVGGRVRKEQEKG